MQRRTVLAGVGALVAGTVGGFFLIRDRLSEFASAPVSVDGDARASTGYDETGVEEIVVEENVGGVQEVVVTNYMTEHEKTIDMGLLGSQRGAVFIALSTPQVSVFGRQFNPIEDMSADELVALVQDNYEGIENVSHDDDERVTILDQTTTQSRFTADALFDGTSIDVYLHVSEAVETDDDHVVTIGVYPQRLRSQEESNVFELMEGVLDELPDSFDPDEGDDDDEDEDEESDTGSDQNGDDGAGSENEDDGNGADDEEGEDDEEDDGGLLGL